MKLKRILIILLSSCLLTGCDFVNNIIAGFNNALGNLNFGQGNDEISSSEKNEQPTSSDEIVEENSSSTSVKPNDSSFNSEISSEGGNQSFNSSLNSSSNETSTVEPKPEPTIDYFVKDAYKEISLKEPDFTTRVIASKDDVTFEDLFNLGNKVSIKVDISDKQLQLLENDYQTGYKSEVYRIADKVEISLTNNGNTYTWEYDQVGIRQKGNTSRKQIFADGKIANLNHFKLSFDETFDDPEKYGNSALDWSNDEAGKILREDREFLGLTGFDIKWNKNYDASHIREIYASYLYDAAGLMTNSIGLTEFNINQKDKNRNYDFGLCTLFEPVSKSFIKRELKKGPYVNTGTWDEEKLGTFGVLNAKYGDYYKASYGVGNGNYGNGADLSSNSSQGNRVGIGNVSGSYIPVYERKTNQNDPYDDGLIKNLTKVITNSTYEEIEKVIDLENFAITEACNYLIGNPDDLRNNNNNYTIYFRRTDGKAMILPIDNDRCFGITRDWNPDGHGMTEKGVFDTKPAARDSLNKLHEKTILARTSNEAKAIYLTYCKALKVSDWMKYDTFKKYYDIAYKTYGNSSCSTSFGDGFDFNINGANDNWGFRDYLNKKLELINLDQVITSSGNESNNSGNSGNNGSNTNNGNYGDIYLIGNFMNWEQYNKNYPFEYKGEGVYTVSFNAYNLENGTVKYKIYDGENYQKIDWTVVDNELIMEVGSSAKIYDCYNGQKITITINTITKNVEIVKG